MLEAYIIFSLVVIFIVLPVLFKYEEISDKRIDAILDFDEHVDTAIDMKHINLN